MIESSPSGAAEGSVRDGTCSWVSIQSEKEDDGDTIAPNQIHIEASAAVCV